MNRGTTKIFHRIHLKVLHNLLKQNSAKDIAQIGKFEA